MSKWLIGTAHKATIFVILKNLYISRGSTVIPQLTLMGVISLIGMLGAVLAFGLLF
tara:strand:+ start:127 stop:294 length:168 start_codon:yes stop_codon:yes gene_type:complete